MTDLVVASLEAWDGVWRRNQHLVSRLLARDPEMRVLFVEPPADPTHALTRRAFPRAGRGLRPVDMSGAEGRLWALQPTKWLPRRLDPGADRRLAKSVRKAAAQLGMSAPVLWVNDPAAAELLRQSGWPALYDITDDWLTADRSSRERERVVDDETYLLQHCQEVVVCSPRLLETKHARHVTLIPNAVDVDAYAGELPRPADLPSGPVVLYLGTLHRDRLDVELTADLARSLGNQARVVLVGPVALDREDQALLTSRAHCSLGHASTDCSGVLDERRRAGRAARRHAVHRQPRPDQGLRVPRRRAPRRQHSGRRLPRGCGHRCASAPQGRSRPRCPPCSPLLLPRLRRRRSPPGRRAPTPWPRSSPLLLLCVVPTEQGRQASAGGAASSRAPRAA